MPVVELSLEVAAYEHDGQGQAEVEGAEQQEAAEEVVVRGAYLAHGLRQLYDRDDRQQR